MMLLILCAKFTVGQYHQMIESGILTDRGQYHRFGSNQS